MRRNAVIPQRRAQRISFALYRVGPQKLRDWFNRREHGALVPVIERAYAPIAELPEDVVVQRSRGSRVRTEVAPDKLRKLADTLEEAIHDKLHPAIGQQNVTRRRAGIAASMADDARHLQRVQRVLRGLAEDFEAGAAPAEVTQIDNRRIVEDLLRWDRHPARTHTNRLRSLVDDAEEAGVRGQVLARVARLDRGDDYGEAFQFTEDDALALEALVKAVQARYDTQPRKSWERARKIHFDDHKDALRAFKAGIDTPAQWTAARNYVRAKADAEAPRNAPDVAIKAKLRELVGHKIAGFFPTPPALAARVVEAAGIRPGEQVLEPSAGYGAIADAAKAAGAEVFVFEVNARLREILKLKGFQVLGEDFTAAQPDEVFDAVVMNPPFEDSQDAQHVQRAYRWLKPGGRLVAIVGEGLSFRRQDQGFRDWLDEHGTWEKLPDNSFAKNTLTGHTTGVATRLVTVQKPAT